MKTTGFPLTPFALLFLRRRKVVRHGNPGGALSQHEGPHTPEARP